jgi:transcriptional regulator with XRE-family HTH domain
MTRTQLKIIRARMGLTQAELTEKLKMARNSVARMESGRMIITPPMALLISFVAGEAGVDAVNPRRGRKAAQGKRAHAKTAKAAAGKARKAVQV